MRENVSQIGNSGLGFRRPTPASTAFHGWLSDAPCLKLKLLAAVA